ncbi:MULTISPECIES: ImmA/IrrE family metallo-endopeptidase [Acidiphilium]|uniref:IrrE N-terminal-like domain-containing protein n=1 Tax=Acidiphilium rubrum TaxID=526 RepID=A0A8G2FFN7_ACIRU|nr:MULTISPECIES: ImmA/IrrE family metallo-endopeptidase [Acidiphilium]SIQ46892.1 protein of unknown function [Acidiphilium rubrum]
MSAVQERESPIEIVGRFLRSAPVDLHGIAAGLGLFVVQRLDMSPSVLGSIKRDGPRYRIEVNGRDGENRKRFTLAHEIAHYVLHRDLIGDGVTDDAMYRSGGKLSDEYEVQANKYAASILMPAQLVREAFNRGEKSYAAMAARFQVSPQAAEIRMKELRLG